MSDRSKTEPAQSCPDRAHQTQEPTAAVPTFPTRDGRARNLRCLGGKNLHFNETTFKYAK